MRIGWFVLMGAVVCSSCSRSEAGGTPQGEAVQEAVNHWRGEFDPAWRYLHARCASGVSLADEATHRVAQVLHASRAGACDRLRAVPETMELSVDGNVATVTVHAPDGQTAGFLRFTMAYSGERWTVRKVEAPDAGNLVAIYDTDASGRGASVAPAWSRWAPHGAANWNITHVITYGQSLSQGFFNKPVLSTRQRYASLRFAGGVRAQDNIGPEAASSAAAYARFVPLIETQAGQKGETPTAGTLDMAMQLIEQENLQDYAALPYQFLGSAPGEGSLSIEQLSKPGAYYDQLMRDVTNGERLATVEGKTYGVGAVTWSQGEANDSNGTPISGYVALLRKLRNDIDHDAKAVTHQTADVELITYQVATNRRFGQPFPHIALALLEASHEDPHIHLAVPMYLFRYVDGGHTDDRSTQWFGAYYGLVLKRILIDHATWKPLEPTGWQKDGVTATLRFNVPVPPLQWDTTQVAGNSHYGFSLRLPSGALLPIKSVSLVGADRLQIVAATRIPDGTHLQYAFDGVGVAGSRFGPRGNLRDSQGDAIQFDNGRERLRMDNWCVIFDVLL